MRLFRLNAYWFGLAFLWNAVHPLILPQLVDTLGGAARNTLYGLLTFAGLVLAMFVQPLCGALSDYTVSRWGRRRPWILVGTLSAVVWLYALVLSRSYVALALSYMALQLSSNVAHGPAQGLIPDCVPTGSRGKASGVKSLLDMLGVIMAALVISRIIDASAHGLLISAGIIATLLLASMSVTLFGIREPASMPPEHGLHLPLGQQLRAALVVRIRPGSDYARLLASRFFIFFGIYTAQSFAYYFVADVMHVAAPARIVGNLMSIIGLSVLVAAYPAGLFSERLGRRRLSLWACLVVGLGLASLVVVREVSHLSVLGVALGLGMGVFNTVNWAWATDLVPPAEAGKYLGFSNVATAGSAALSRLAGPLIDAGNAWRPEAGYMLLFALGALSAFVALAITWTLADARVPAGTGSAAAADGPRATWP